MARTHIGHNFSVKTLDRLPGLLGARRYLYHCIRCKWSFMVNDGQRGTVTALDGEGGRLDGLESSRRLATFSDGPCPALQSLNGHATPDDRAFSRPTLRMAHSRTGDTVRQFDQALRRAIRPVFRG